MKTNKITFISVLTLLLITTSHDCFAQFGRILNRVTDRVSDRLEQKVADAIADEIMRKAFKPLDQAVDEAMRKSFEDSIGTSEVDYNKMGRAYGDFLAGMNGAVEKVAPDYTFDIVVDVKLTDEKNKPQPMKMFYTKSGKAIAYQTSEKKKTTTVIFDVTNEVMVMYTEDGKNRTGQVLPNITKLTAALVRNANKEDSQDDKDKLKITKNGKTKKVANYNCIGYLITDKDYKNEVYISEDFPISFIEAYAPFIKQFAPSSQFDAPNMQRGFMFYSQTKDNSDKTMNTYEVTKVTMGTTKFSKADYKFAQ